MYISECASLPHAVQWFQKAADQGHVEAQFAFGVFFSFMHV